MRHEVKFEQAPNIALVCMYCGRDTEMTMSVRDNNSNPIVRVKCNVCECETTLMGE